jgi:thiosulfate/3-mercaptopyruvate sulfurtransferase
MNRNKNVLVCVLVIMVAVAAHGCQQHAIYPNAGLLVSGDELQKLIDDGLPNTVIIDARDYGNASQKIPGSINLRWQEFVDSSMRLKAVAELEQLLGAAGLTRDQKIIIYDNAPYSGGAAGRIFWMLEYLGCHDVHILNGGWEKWVEDGRPAEDMWPLELEPALFTATVRGERLATKEQLATRLDDADCALIDARSFPEYHGWQLYGELRGGHIPGAVNINYESFFNSDTTVLHYSSLKSLLETHGIIADREIIAYDTMGIRSGFVYFICRLMGYSRCANYDGSIVEWSADTSLPLEKMENYQSLVYPAWVDALIRGENPPTYQGNGYVILNTSWTPEYTTDPTDYAMGHIPGAIFMDTYDVENGPSREPLSPVEFGDSEGRPDLLATMEQVREVSAASTSDTIITDDRSWDEYIGASNSYYGYFDEKGRIPQARWIGDWTELLGDDINLFQSMGVVKKNWETAGFSPDKKMYFYCGTGWRSGLYTYYAYLLGWPAANYDGGWYEWSTNPDNPRETGEP